MALWKDPAPTPSSAPAPVSVLPRAVAEAPARASFDRAAGEPAAAAPRAKERAEIRESVIAAGLAIEGKISGTGHVRIAGQFKGDVNVEGNLSIEPGAKHQGEVRAAAVTVGGELTGNIAAKHIDVTASGVIVGDVKADTITVASGSRMRGHVEFGWSEGTATGARSEFKGSGLPS